MSDKPEDDSASDAEPHPVTLLEKVATAVSALLIAALVAVLLWDAVHEDTAAAFRAEIRPLTRNGPLYRAAVGITNVGDEAAKSVVVHVELVAVAKDSVLADTDVTIDWLPGQSRRDIVSFFPPFDGYNPVAVRAEVRGYAIP